MAKALRLPPDHPLLMEKDKARINIHSWKVTNNVDGLIVRDGERLEGQRQEDL